MILTLLLCSIAFINVNGLDGKQALDYSVKQYTRLLNGIKIGTDYPYEGIPTSDKWQTTPAVRNQWTAGFYPGILWYLYNHTKQDIWKEEAIKATDAMYDDQFTTGTHDVGFMIMGSYGNGYLFTKNSSYPQIIEKAAHSLATRFNCKGCSTFTPFPMYLCYVDSKSRMYSIVGQRQRRTVSRHRRQYDESGAPVRGMETLGKQHSIRYGSFPHKPNH